MYNWGNDILNLTMIGVSLWVTNKFLGIFLERKRTHILGVLAWIMYGGFQLFVEYHKGIGSPWIIVFNIICLYIVATTAFYKSGKSNFFIAISFW